MTDRDPSLDLALRLLQPEGPSADEEARWAKRVASQLSTWKKPSASRADIDALLLPPLPDDHRDRPRAEAHGDAHDELLEDAEDTQDRAAAAADHGTDRSFDAPSISHPPNALSQSGPVSAPSGLAGLARLASSGPPSGRPAAATEAVGAAKADDSGLINLRELSQSGEKPIAREVDAPAPVSKAALDALARTKPQSPAALSTTKGATPASRVPSTSPPSTNAAQVASASSVDRAPTTTSKKKGGSVVWVAFGGIAAAAAIIVYLGYGRSSSDNGASNAPVAAKQADKSKVEAQPSSAATVAATTLTTPPAPPLESASASNAPDEVVAIAPTSTATSGLGMAGGKKPTGYGTPTPTTTAATNGNTTKGGATNEPAKPNPSGGSLDDVLGINKPGPTPTATTITPDLPDKPEAADLRSAINGKVTGASGCVKGLDGPSSVTIAFSPAGTVASVVVTSGPAKGTGAESCIKAAFSALKVPRSKLGGTGYAKLLP